MNNLNLTELTNSPSILANEISRDHLVNRIANNFDSGCQIQLLKGIEGSGKTNTASQFARSYPSHTISYYITDDPQTQRVHTYLHLVCSQLSEILGENPPTADISSQTLNSLFTALCHQLAKKTRKTKDRFYFVIDGIDKALIGNKGERIIDVLPTAYPTSPYILFTCQSSEVTKLPSWVKYSRVEDTLLFSVDETQRFLSTTGFTNVDIVEIHRKHDGIPGSLKIIKDAKCANPTLALNIALAEPDRILEQRIKHVYETEQTGLIAAMELLSVTPMSLPVSLVARLINMDEVVVTSDLLNTSFIQFDRHNRRLELSNTTSRQLIKQRLGNQKTQQLLKSLIETVREQNPEEDLLVTVLIKEAKDYESLQTMLMPNETIKTIHEHPGGLSTVFKRMQLAANLAKENKDANGVLKWSLGIAALKAFIEHVIDEDEIEALIAIGESSDALRKAYAVPDITNKIRLLSKIYSSMREQDIHVAANAVEELSEMVERLNILELDAEIAQKIAIDLFPVLPDSALSLLEKLNLNEDQKNILDVAALAILENAQRFSEEALSSEESKRRVSFELLRSKKLAKASLSELIEIIENLRTSRSKEQNVRYWCRQNSSHPDLYKAIEFWLELVISDRQFVIPLMNLRQICELLPNVIITERQSLANKLRIPQLTALSSPKEEWVRVRLSLTEVNFAFDPSAAIAEVKEIYQIVTQDIDDLDIKTYCFARVLSTVKRCMASDKATNDHIGAAFNKAFYDLLDNSADHYDHVRKTLQTLVDFDPEYALVVASELNTLNRRHRALFAVFRAMLRKHGEKDVSKIIDDILEHLPKSMKDVMLVGVTNELYQNDANLCIQNLNQLLIYIEQIDDPIHKANALVNLALLWKSTSEDASLTLINKALCAWEREEDLRTRLVIGFELVVPIASVSNICARQLFSQLQQLKALPTGTLASGNLGSMYAEIIRLAIRSITAQDITEGKVIVHSLESLILEIPSIEAQIGLYAKLASSLYRIDCKDQADNIVRTKILDSLRHKLSSSHRDELITESLPIIYEYDQSEADVLASLLPDHKRDYAWRGTIAWLLSKSYLGDHDTFDPRNILIPNDRPKLYKALNAARKIRGDMSLHLAIAAIANNAGKSFSQKLDATQTLALLEELDQLARQRLPEPINIKHKGYLILCLSGNNRIRSEVFYAKGQSGTRGITKHDISRRWQEIDSEAKNISNVADRVYVMSLVAKDMSEFYKRDDRRFPKNILEEATDQIANIPTAIDRINRLDTIAESWNKLSETNRVELLLRQAVQDARLLRAGDADKQLSMLVQTGYNILGANFASELITRFDDSRQINESLTEAKIAIQIEKLRRNPSTITSLSGTLQERSNILSTSAQKLLEDLVSGKGRGIEQVNVLFEWLRESHFHEPETTLQICKWFVESGQRGSTQRNKLSVFFEIAELIRKLSQLLTSIDQRGIPESVENSFAGLNSRYITFRSNQSEEAQEWLQNWLKDNTGSFLKICDPYFELVQLNYLKYVPENCKVLIVATEKGINGQITSEELSRYWFQNVSTRDYPFIRILIVPTTYSNKFHDRVIITDNTGLDLGPSINGLGDSKQKIAILTQEEARTLDQQYVRNMLDTTNWLLDDNVNPVILILKPGMQ